MGTKGGDSILVLLLLISQANKSTVCRKQYFIMVYQTQHCKKEKSPQNHGGVPVPKTATTGGLTTTIQQCLIRSTHTQKNKEKSCHPTAHTCTASLPLQGDESSQQSL
jgi:hypothetical protein